MATITKSKTWADNENVTYTDLNANFDGIYNDHNGGITNANISASAGIVESKLALNTSTGHNHDGINSKSIPRVIGWTLAGGLEVNTDPVYWIYINTDQTIVKAVAVVKTAPTGASVIVDIERSADNGANWTSLWNSNTSNRLTIAASGRVATQTNFDITTFSPGDLLRIAVDQIGSTEAGRNLTVQLIS